MSTDKRRIVRGIRFLSAAGLTVMALSGAVRADEISPAQLSQTLVDALHSAFGEHHARAVHAKGIVLDGIFTPDPAAKTLSKASIFAGGAIPVVVRFSDFTGIPTIPDTMNEANPRGFALKIKGADGDEVDIVAHSFNGFPVPTAAEFGVFLRALAASNNAPHPTPIEQYLAKHPVAAVFLATQKPPPVSYATAAYFGVNAYRFTNGDGKSAHVRYRFVPRAGEHYLTPDELKTRGPNYLGEEIVQRVAQAPVLFDWYAQIAEAGDTIDDPSTAWPDSRRQVKLGTIAIATPAADLAAADKQTVFLPGTPHPGIDPADPMLAIRNAAYAISFGQRQ